MSGLERVSPASEFKPALYIVALAVLTGLGLALAPLTVGAGLVAGTAAFLLTLIKVEYGLAFLALSVPFGAVGPFSSDASGLSATEPLVALVVLAWLFRLVVFKEDKIQVSPIFLSLAVFVGVLILSMSTALSLSLSFKELLKWAGLMAVFLVAANSLKTRRQFTIVLVSVIVAALLEALLGWYQFFRMVGPEGFIIGGRFMRAYGTFGQPNPFAGYLALSLPLAYAAVLEVEWVKSKPILGLLAVVGSLVIIGGAIAMSLSRGAWLGVAAAIFVVTSLRSRKAFIFLLALLFLAVVFVSFGALNLLPAELSQRFTDIVAYFGIFDVRHVVVTQENWAIVERMASWQAGWNMFQDHVWLGLGPGNFGAYYLDYALPGWEDTGGGHAHNIYLNILAEMGVVGLAAYLSFIVTSLAFLVIAFRKVGSAMGKNAISLDGMVFSLPISQRMFILGAIGMLVALHVHNFFDNLYVHGVPVHVGLVLGMAVAACLQTNKEPAIPKHY